MVYEPKHFSHLFLFLFLLLWPTGVRFYFEKKEGKRRGHGTPGENGLHY